MSRRLIALSAPLMLLVALVAVLAASCGGGETPATTAITATPASTATITAGISETTTGVPVSLEPIVVPTLPEVIPGYTELDPATGLHMTGTPTEIDVATYRLAVTGKVARALSLTYDDLRRLPKMTAKPLLVCQGFFTDEATWSGASLKTILEMAGVQPGAYSVKMKGADGYSWILTLEEALQPENFLAYEWEGQPLPVLHGFPVRAVIPGADGNRWVKWLLEIVVE
jgi:DMSO/TMAO reductase YedYZ molybdopterin-dependent catalytic subunit